MIIEDAKNYGFSIKDLRFFKHRFFANDQLQMKCFSGKIFKKKRVVLNCTTK